MKDVSSRMVINAQSAHGERMKENVNINECMRVMRNCSDGVGEKNVKEHLTYYMKRMQVSGYSVDKRFEVVRKAFQREEKKGREIGNRSKNVRKKGHEWYLKDGKYDSLIVVDATPKERLKKTVESVAKKHGVKVKVVEKRGRTLKGMLQKSNPFGVQECKKRDCVVCRNSMGVDCRKRGVVYEIECQEEMCKKKYIGQTGRTLYERFKGHEQRVAGRVNGGVMGPVEKHREEHGNRDFRYSVRIRDSLYGKATKRIISEVVRIDNLERGESFNRKQGWTHTGLYRDPISHSEESFEEGLVGDIVELENALGIE